MRKQRTVFILAVLFLASFYLLQRALPAAASDLSCIASPPSGPVGTLFHLTAVGFDPNATVWLYAVEPGGAAFSDPEFGGFGGASKAGPDGVVSFTFASRFDSAGTVIGRALGAWTLVVEQPGPGGTLVHQAACIVDITSGGEQTLAGALLAVTPNPAVAGTDLLILGSGFAPGEAVNLWLTPPPNCSGFGFELGGIPYHYSAASSFSAGGTRANGQGAFAYVLPTSKFFSCLGDWAASAYAPVSGRGAVAYFSFTSAALPDGATLIVSPSSGPALGGRFLFTGANFASRSAATCWLTRPDGNVRPVGTFKTDDAGTFSFVFTTGLDDPSLGITYSEGALGLYTMTCRDNHTGVTGFASFTLTGMEIDP